MWEKMETMESSSPNKARVYDELRKLWVVATPEEIVRQKLLKKMVGSLAYPKALISVERSLAELCSAAVSVPYRRVDVVCFAKEEGKLLPLLVIECKEKASDQQEAIAQVQGYNRFLQARFIAVASPDGEIFGYRTLEGMSFLPFLPSYSELTRQAFNG